MGKKGSFLIIIVILMSIGFITYSYGNYPIKSMQYPPGPLINSSDKVMIIAPHPDDEAIGNAGVIRYCVENKIPVKVVVVTDGDIGRGLAVKRHDESVEAMEILGLNQSNLVFLGYRDESLPNLLSKNWDYKNPYVKNGTNSNANYSFSYEKNATYCGSNLDENLEELVSQFNPTLILYPDSEDEQIDHWATYAFVEYSLNRIDYQGAKYTYIVHDPPSWPWPRTYNPENYLLPPAELSQIGYKWVGFPLNHYQERLKESAINTYSSQVGTDSYIKSFIRKNEIFGINPVTITNTTTNETLDFFSGENFPEAVITEPEKNEKGKGSIRSREITSVGFKIDKNSTWMSLRTKGNISSSDFYELHILTFKENRERIDIKIYNGTASYEVFSNNSFHNGDKIKIQNTENGFIIQMPSSVFNDVQSFLISADILDGYPMLDWTAWRKVDIVR